MMDWWPLLRADVPELHKGVIGRSYLQCCSYISRPEINLLIIANILFCAALSKFIVSFHPNSISQPHSPIKNLTAAGSR